MSNLAFSVAASPTEILPLVLVCAGLRHVAGTQWGSKKYMKHLEASLEEASIAG